MKGLTVGQFDKICRACLSQSEEIFQIFEVTYDNTHLWEIFCTYLNIEIERDDPLPQHICKSCIVLLVQLHMFILHCQRSDVVLKTLVRKQNEGVQFSCDGENGQNDQESCNFETDPKDELTYDLGPVLSNPIEYIQEEDQVVNDDSILFGALLCEHNNDIQSCDKEENNRESCDFKTEPQDEIIYDLGPDLSDPIEYVEEENQTVNNDSILFGALLYEQNDNEEENDQESCNFENDSKAELKDDEDSLDCTEYVQEKSQNEDEPSKRCLYLCRYCGISFNSHNDLQKHRQEVRHPSPRSHECRECGKKFSKNNLRLHMRTHTGEKPFACQRCQKSFSLKHNLQRHVMTHTGEKPYVCDICGKGFIQAGTLVEHKRVHTKEKPFICSYCGLSFGQAATHKVHLRRHLPENTDKKPTRRRRDKLSYNFKCDVCLKSFTSGNSLNTHLLTHGEKSFLCTYCGKAFVYKAGLLSHMKVHTGQRPHACSVCNRRFAQLHSLKAHMLSHTGEKPYTCSVCDKRFSLHQNLKSHALIHTGEKPFACKICSKAFTQSSHLKYHMVTHSGERAYACAYCGKTFALKINLTVHTRIHTGETSHVCDLCGKGFHGSSSMKWHRKGHQGNVEINTSDCSILV